MADPDQDLPSARPVPVETVRRALPGARRTVVLDDDPTGTQTIRDLPVLTRWTADDIAWALAQPAPAFFVLTNSRSLGSDAARRRNREVAEACFDAAEEAGFEVVFASRSDSTLRGHFPLETDELAAVSAERGRPVDAVLLVPAYVDAGRVTVDGVHRLRGADGWTAVGDSEFARDATFGFTSSRLADWVAEKSGGRVPAEATVPIPLALLRSDADAVAERLATAPGGSVVIPDALTDDDLRAVVLGVLAAEARGRRFVYRVGPSFVRALAGQDASPPLPPERLAELVGPAPGLVVVGSHVGQTTRQLERLRDRTGASEVVLDVEGVVRGDGAVEAARDALLTVLRRGNGPAVLGTSRTRITGADADESLAIARRVSAAVVEVVRETVRDGSPGFVLAKGGITSADVATEALGIGRAWARGTLLPGIVSLWQAADGPASGIPYIVFAGNVGDDDALADVVTRLEEGRKEKAS
ncbi:four-carbon acid sugar kinase family protein [Amnibacterium sp. CER49]|uniref:four-carbon acid sugar kinase family protein n=1 Tax=Amnibacterium sp. CER49 TaxID=3039161 RepID=UPI00244A524F|nr:four-carbon acid sugar kinase family protein [Amnibacterium sp. CER49]MDH2443477.1 four-carbon acid sugar kinase family protein [Amnibacterium sp. CER49]